MLEEAVFFDSDCEFVESQSFSFSAKSEGSSLEGQGGMSIEGTPEKTPPASRRKIHAIGCGDDLWWVPLFQAVMARMENYLNRCESLEVETKELEYSLLAPEEQDVGLRRIALHASGDRHQRLFHTFSQQGRSEFWVASVARWDEARVACGHDRKGIDFTKRSAGRI